MSRSELLDLVPHPACPDLGAEAIRITFTRAPEEWRIQCSVRGDFSGLQWPALSAVHRSRAVWQSTCLELFVRRADSPAYRNFCFSPSGAWNCYDFASYRSDPSHQAERGIPVRVAQTRNTRERQLDIRISRELIPHPPGRLGIGFTLEDQDGHKSIWALGHPSRTPDLHHPDGFTLAA